MDDLLIKRGEFLRTILKENNIKIKDFAAMLFVSSQAVTHWLNGDNEITSDKIMAICNILKIKPEELLNGEYNNMVKEPRKYEKTTNLRGIEDLSQAELREVAEAYCNNIPKDRITKMYKFDVGSAKLIDVMPPIYLDEKCRYCNLPMVVGFKSKEMYPYCPRCGHKELDKCNCDNCNAKRLHCINENMNSKPVDIDLNNVSLIDVLTFKYLLSNAYLVENNYYFRIHQNHNSYSENISIVKYAFENNYLVLCEDSDLRYVKYDYKTYKLSFTRADTIIFKINFNKSFVDRFFEENFLEIKQKIISKIYDNIVDYFLSATENYVYSKLRLRIVMKENHVKKIEELFKKYSYAELSTKVKYLVTDYKKKILRFEATWSDVENKFLMSIVYFTQNVENKGMPHIVDTKPIYNSEIKALLDYEIITEDDITLIFNTKPNEG